MIDSLNKFTVSKFSSKTQAKIPTKREPLAEPSKRRLLMVQYAGDYRETVQRFAEGGGETYYAQKYSVNAVAEMGQKIEEAMVLCCMTGEPYNEVLQNGVRAIGAGFTKEIKVKNLIKLIEEQNPTHLVVRALIPEVFRWAIAKKVPTIATFAESISTGSLRRKLRNYWIANLLNNEQIEWIGTYGINSSTSFNKIGVKAEKIIPWDFPGPETPDSFFPKKLSRNGNYWQLFYIGSMIDAKGVGDLLETIAQLKSRNFKVKLKMAGEDKKGFYLHQARQLKIEDCVEFLGLVPNNTVVPLMRESDLVLVPSRHNYPEGFPLAITHALCSRTPIVASDHPMFLKDLRHGINAMIFPAGNSIALSECIEKILSDSDLYQNLSIASCEAWEQLQIPVKWADLIKCWLDGSHQNQQWLFNHRFSSGLYDKRISNSAITQSIKQ